MVADFKDKEIFGFGFAKKLSKMYIKSISEYYLNYII
jgi:hypothetical protein